MRAMRCVLAGLLAAVMVTVVVAQPGGRQFGGGGGGDVNSLVLTNAALQEDLKVTAEQKAKFKPVAEKQAEIQKAFGELFAKGFKDVDKEKSAELREKSAKTAEEAKKVVEDTLTADQKKRLHQIAIQQTGFTAFNDPEAKAGKGGFGGPTEAQKAIIKEVSEALKLSDKQRSTIKGVTDEFNKESREIRQEAGIGGGFTKGKAPTPADPEKVEAANKKIDKLRKEAWAKVEEALDSTQKTAWKGLVGEPFDLAKLRPVAPKKD